MKVKSKLSDTANNYLKHTKKQKGITLIALVITIIVLLILAGISVSMLTGQNGILNRAQEAKEETENAQKNEEEVLDNYNQYIEGVTNGGTLVTVTGRETTNTKVQDSLGNIVTVPAGFRVVNPGDNVEDGIIIEDVNHRATAGSQFVWIPVGTIHRKDKEDVTITLGRYVYNEDGTINTELSKTDPSDQLKISSTRSSYYTEGLKDSLTTNNHAKDIESFILKVNNEVNGYYIGRFEARTATQRNSKNDLLTQIMVKPDDYVYNCVTQEQAAEISQEMYSDTNFTSDLINSYAWDTAIDFFQKCDNRTDKTKPYSMQNSLNIGSLAEKGTKGTEKEDVICNVYDMASNCLEWSTETYSLSDKPCTVRGGCYSITGSFTAYRNESGNSIGFSGYSFRPILYMY